MSLLQRCRRGAGALQFGAADAGGHCACCLVPRRLRSARVCMWGAAAGGVGTWAECCLHHQQQQHKHVHACLLP